MLWAKFGLAADVGAAPAAVRPGGRPHQRPDRRRCTSARRWRCCILLLPDRRFRSKANRDRAARDQRRDRHGTALPDGGGVFLLRGIRRPLQHRRVRLSRVSHGSVHRHLGRVSGAAGAGRGRDAGGAGRILRCGAGNQPGFVHEVRFRAAPCSCSRPMPWHSALAVALYATNTLSVSSNRVENELVQNGHSSFFRAARTSDIDYESYYADAPNRRPTCSLLESELAADGAPFHAARARQDGPVPCRPARRPRPAQRRRRLERVVRRRVQQAARLEADLDAELRRVRATGALVRQHLCVRHAHRARSGGDHVPRFRRSRPSRSCAGRATRASAPGAGHEPARLPHAASCTAVTATSTT